jgi:hypothetical protein
VRLSDYKILVSTFGLTSVIRSVSSEAKAHRDLERRLVELGDSPAVERCLSKYGKVRTKSTYATMLAQYFRWLKEQQGWKGKVSPDLLIEDNLVYISKSETVDVQTKGRHTDWLNLYINVYLRKKGVSPSHREVSASAVRKFYKSKRMSRIDGRERPEPCTSCSTSLGRTGRNRRT